MLSRWLREVRQLIISLVIVVFAYSARAAQVWYSVRDIAYPTLADMR